MFLEIINILSALPFFILHIDNPISFPNSLSKSEELKYIKYLENGDKNARNKLIKHNLRLVAHISKKYYFSNSELDDLISIGTIGLIKAVNTYNSKKGIRLSSYASRCIENEILMHFRNLKKSSTNIYMNDPIDTDKNGNILTLSETIPSNDCVIDTIINKINIQKLKEILLKNLSPREKIIICMRYGICGFCPMPQREVAKKLKISRSYVSRIEKKALLHLRNLLSFD